MKTDREIVELLKETGHLEWPFGKLMQDLPAPGLDMLSFPLTHPTIEKAIASYQDFTVVSLDPLAMQRYGRSICCDGDPGPELGSATRDLWEQPRCGCPDYGPEVQPVVGEGSWKECHDIGKFHAAMIYVDERNMPSRLKSRFEEVWALFVAAFDEIGLRFIRTDDKNDANIIFSFVNRAPWLGLAIVGSGQSCGSTIWAKFNASWNPKDLVDEWVVLIMHEAGHNASLRHTRGGVMNAYLVLGLRPTWIGDVSEPILKRLYGGEPIPPVTPPPPPVAEGYGILEWWRGKQPKEQWDVLPEAKTPSGRHGVLEWFEGDRLVGKHKVIRRAEIS